MEIRLDIERLRLTQLPAGDPERLMALVERMLRIRIEQMQSGAFEGGREAVLSDLQIEMAPDSSLEMVAERITDTLCGALTGATSERSL